MRDTGNKVGREGAELEVLEFGHLSNTCNGMDRSKQCLNCGKEGHLVRNCQKAPFCILCKAEGHRTGNFRCLKNKKRRGRK